MPLRVVTRQADVDWRTWDEVAVASQAEVFLLSDWLEPWLTWFGGDGSPHVLEVRDGASLVGGLPLVRQGRVVTRLEMVGGGVAAADHVGPIGSAGAAGVDVALFDHLLAESPADVLALEGLDAETEFARRLRGHAHANGGSVGLMPCPYLSLPESFDDYLAARSRNYRSSYRRNSRAITARGGRFETVDQEADVVPTTEAMVRLHLASRADSGAASTFRRPAMLGFHRDVALRLFHRGVLRMHRLVAGGEIVAVEYCLRSRASVHFYAGGYDPSWGWMSPGDQMLAYSIQAAIEEGAGVFDLLRGDESYKSRIATGVRHDLRITTPLTRRGRAFIAVDDTARRTWRRLRSAVRQAA